MRVALITPSSSPISFCSKVVLIPCTRQLVHHNGSLLLETRRRQCTIRCSIKTWAAECFGESKRFGNYLKDLADHLWESSPAPVKEFPWKKAESVAIEQLLDLGHKAFRFAIIALLAISFASDVTMAVLRNRELLIPPGLFIGVALADFLKEFSQSLVQSTIKDENKVIQLWGIGMFFVLIKFIPLCINVQGMLLLPHIGNGGLMQILWLAKEQHQTRAVEDQESSVANISIPSYSED